MTGAPLPGLPRRPAGLAAGLSDRQVLTGGAVVLVALVALWRRGQKTKPAAPNSVTATQPYDSSAYDSWNAWQSEYENLQKEIDQLKPVGASPPGAVPTSPPPYATFGGHPPMGASGVSYYGPSTPPTGGAVYGQRLPSGISSPVVVR